MLTNDVTRRIAGTIGVLLLVAAVYLGLTKAFEPAPGSITFTAELGNAGVGLTQGNSVKVRGVEIGQVVSTDYDNGLATAQVRIDPGVEIPRNGLVLVVTAKTLLGEKQIEMSFPDDQFGNPPFIENGDVIAQDRQPTEVSDALDALTPFLEGIDEEDLATVIDILGSQQGEGEIIAQNLDLSAQVAAFLERTADEQTDRLTTLTSVLDQLTPAAGEFDRLNANLPNAVSLLVEREADIDSNLDLLSAFSITLADYIQVEDDRIRQLLLTGDAVGTVLDPNMDNVASFVQGAHEYTLTLGKPADFLTDGTIWAGFRILLDLSSVGFPLGEGGIDLTPIFGGSPGALPIDITDLTGEGGPLSDLLPGRTFGARNPTEVEPAPSSGPSAPPDDEPEVAPEPTNDDQVERGSLLDGRR